MAKQNTERADPLAAVGLQPKQATKSEQNTPQLQQRNLYPPPAESQATQEASIRPEIPAQEGKSDDEKATEKVTVYFTPPQYDHIDELRQQYRKRTKQRISVNALLRRLVERANLEDILPD